MNLHLPVHMHNPFEPAVFRAKPTFLLAAVPELADPEFRARQLRAMQASSNDTVDLVACCDVVDLSEDDPPASASSSATASSDLGPPTSSRQCGPLQSKRQGSWRR
ncbi:unnamed protein product [Symbiodinium natans]|uniref:Uncharacterized protein n=1 Tax=Symbiodinium natans TaxID=878477 RepID=A0A812RVU3_9DINO|nr:unnamed protein product [Symbiodinium natans]